MIMAGPCAAETREQVLAAAAALSAAGVKVFRAGVWKPRTRPGMFEGRGREALQWLKEAKEAFGLSLAVEVANPSHIADAISFGIDILWIGARTVTNPFQVQEIADALRGTDIPVLVKNPVSPDTGLWTGALERLNAAGVKRLGAVHRGFSIGETGLRRR